MSQNRPNGRRPRKSPPKRLAPKPRDDDRRTTVLLGDTRRRTLHVVTIEEILVMMESFVADSFKRRDVVIHDTERFVRLVGDILERHGDYGVRPTTLQCLREACELYLKLRQVSP